MTAKGGGAGPSMTGGRGSRALKVRVRSGKGRTLASKLWLERQLNDPYVARAKREGMRSRAAFKLAEIDDRFHLFKPGSKVVDLGAAPGGWSQVAAQRTLAADGRGKVVAIDLLDMPPLPGVAFLNLDFLDPAAPERLEALLSGPADVVMSDMAANATGHRRTDHLKIMGLAEAAAEFAREVLEPGGVFLAFEINDSWIHRLGHIKSTFTPVSPGSAFARLTQAGFSHIAADLRRGGFRLSATRAKEERIVPEFVNEEQFAGSGPVGVRGELALKRGA